MATKPPDRAGQVWFRADVYVLILSSHSWHGHKHHKGVYIADCQDGSLEGLVLDLSERLLLEQWRPAL